MTALKTVCNARILGLLHTSGLVEQLQQLKPRAVSEDELCCFHDRDYVQRVKAASAADGGTPSRGAPVPAGGYEIATLAVGGTLTAIDAVLGGTVRNAYALVRPPGHHAEPDHGAGLCIFANAAVATRLAMRKHGLTRVAIIDWDAHHGNGTETAFYDDPNVLTVSVHQDLIIPGRGAVADCGRDRGKGYNINIPLPPGCGTGAYLAVMDRIVAPALRRFRPELVPTEEELHAVRFEFDRAPPLETLMLHFCGEIRLNHWYRRAAEWHTEPVIRRLYELISRDEARHGGAYLQFMKRAIERCGLEAKRAFARIGVLMASPHRAGKPLHPTNLHVNESLFPNDTVQSRLPDPGWLERWLDHQIRFDAAWERRVVAMILHNLGSLFGQTFASVQDLNRFRKALPRAAQAA